MRWCWVMVLIMASESPRRGWLLLEEELPISAVELAHLADVKVDEMEKALDLLLQNRMLQSVDGLLHVTGWEECQYESDSSTERSRKCRTKAATSSAIDTPQDSNESAAEMKHHSSVAATPSDTDTDSDSETETETDTETPAGTGGDNRGAGTKAEAQVVTLSLVSSSSSRKSISRRAMQEVTYPPWFEEIWGACPRKVEKERAFAVCQSRLKEGHAPEEMLTAIVNYGRQCKAEGTEECYIKHPASFFGPQRPFLEWRDHHGECAKRTVGQISRRAARGGSFPVPITDWSLRTGGVE